MTKLRLACCLVMLGILADADRRTALAQAGPEAPAAISRSLPAFEVASVRKAPPEQQNGPSYARSPRPPHARASGRFDATATLLELITWAFGVDSERVEGSFRELDEVFVIAAKAPGPVLLVRRGEVGPMNQMVQSLLADRFKLRVRWETRTPCGARRRTDSEGISNASTRSVPRATRST